MPEKKRFQCLNCGHRFEADVLTREEKEERRRRDRHFATLDCPNCGRTDIRSEWS